VRSVISFGKVEAWQCKDSLSHRDDDDGHLNSSLSPPFPTSLTFVFTHHPDQQRTFSPPPQPPLTVNHRHIYPRPIRLQLRTTPCQLLLPLRLRYRASAALRLLHPPAGLLVLKSAAAHRIEYVPLYPASLHQLTVAGSTKQRHHQRHQAQKSGNQRPQRAYNRQQAIWRRWGDDIRQAAHAGSASRAWIRRCSSRKSSKQQRCRSQQPRSQQQRNRRRRRVSGGSTAGRIVRRGNAEASEPRRRR
jgi:hypothetical protein